ncbi:MAG: alpha/beta hydrolase [Proteobacteria bacterium]|nr:alpha/beta hydrolase [Burkholderiales bacterium]
MSLDPDYYERQYNNRLTIPDANAFNARGAERSIAARARLRAHLDLEYGPSPRQRIDLFPAADPASPLLSFIHGGYWRARDKAEFSFIAEPFVAAGISVALPEYDLTPAVDVRTIVAQMIDAHVWLYRNAATYGADPSRLFVAGHSAGGHLSAMMATVKWPCVDGDHLARPDAAPSANDLPLDLVKGVYTISGVFDLAPMLHFSFNADIGLDQASAKSLSPITQTPARPMPVHTAVGALESDEFKRQCRVLAEHWPNNVRGHLEVPDCHHLSIVEALADPRSLLFRSVRDMVQRS